ncbi:MAG: precorrin-4 C(11)-methyltransferase [Bacteroidales bacterium]|jgi:precorrin-4 C11-methyltransferase|nr:precorrin-4 C(11)-methyltransferase [Bacteroidales bacterium]
MKPTSIITHSDAGEKLANKLSQGVSAKIYRSPDNFAQLWNENDALIFVGALGICVRTIAPFLESKKTDPAVLNVDANGTYVQSVISGHLGGANALATEVSKALAATPIITTVSDTTGLWSLDMLAQQYDWQMECSGDLTPLMAKFVNGKPTALLLEARDQGTLFLETEKPAHVKVFLSAFDIRVEDFELILAVTPSIYDFGDKAIFYRPAMVVLGLGCQKKLDGKGLITALEKLLIANRISPLSLGSIGTATIKAQEPALKGLAAHFNINLETFSPEELSQYDVPNPSEKVMEVTGNASVSEAVAMHLSKNELLVEKQKGKVGEKQYTYAIALKSAMERKGHIEIVGAGPGDPELVSVRGKRLLQSADCILYAGSLVPKELTHYAKAGCFVASSAGMDLQKQIDTMMPYVERGLLVVRLHTGDPCIYGAIQEQMNKLDQLKVSYHITPGISSFQAAAAALKSQFTIPEEVQSIILTRGEGRTAMPNKEKLHLLARSQSTMCLYLSATLATKVQADLLVHYPPETPVAICYKLTWKEENIWQTTLAELASTVTDNNLSMTTMIVVGKAIGNRRGESKLYHRGFTHAFREGK